MGTTQSTTIFPASGVASSASVAACPANGTATMTRSAAPATSTFEPPVTETSPPAEAVLARVATSAATSAARSASRDPSRTRWPAAASRTARPLPCGPVPPSTPTTSSSTARPSVTCPPRPRRTGRRPPRDHARQAGRVRQPGPEPSVVLPGTVLGRKLLLALGDRLQRVLGLLASLVRAEAVPLGAPVARLDGVVLEAVEPGSPGHAGPPRIGVGAMDPSTFSPLARRCSGIDHHLVVPGVERGHLLGREGAAAAPELGQLEEEVLPGDARREQDEERRPLVAVVAEPVGTAL